jgi:hypothetical protein
VDEPRTGSLRLAANTRCLTLRIVSAAVASSMAMAAPAMVTTVMRLRMEAWRMEAHDHEIECGDETWMRGAISDAQVFRGCGRRCRRVLACIDFGSLWLALGMVAAFHGSYSFCVHEW